MRVFFQSLLQQEFPRCCRMFIFLFFIFFEGREI